MLAAVEELSDDNNNLLTDTLQPHLRCFHWKQVYLQLPGDSVGVLCRAGSSCRARWGRRG
jgi:hypothetical protein